MTIPFPQPVCRLIDRIDQAGYQVYGVGGAIRDLLLGREPKDWDLCTNAFPQQVKAVFGEDAVRLTGARHGTVTVLWEGRSYEVTTYRQDGPYSDGRHPDQVRFVASIQEDLARRDFTINAMACRPGEPVVDPFGGQKDLEAGLVRAVGDPVRRFQEDGLRMVRALRFAAAYGFQVEEATGRAAEELSFRLEGVSAQRIGKEWEGFLPAPGAGKQMGAFPRLMSQILPMVLLPEEDPARVWKELGERIDRLPAEALVRLGFLFCRKELPPSQRMERAAGGAAALALDGENRRFLLELAEGSTSPLPASQAGWLRWRAQMGEGQLEWVLAIRREGSGTPEERAAIQAAAEACRKALAACPCRDRRDLAVDGRCLAALGVSPGREMGALLERLLEEVWAGRLPNRREALEEAAARFLAERR
ncbi:MAG TPA: tRNA nucleotidyltransferase [Firmicutes bacterium]|nr:tRNA nucleotidyltransferase [Bacillota bacterium]